jgi:ABC-2 type transport system permease protein
VSGAPHLWRALAAVAELRVRLTWRRLRSRGGTAEGIALVLLALLAVPGSAILAAVVGAGSYRAAMAGDALAARVQLGAIFFGIWQTWTAVSLSLADREALDLRRFAVFPLPLRRVYALGLATSMLADPFAVFWPIVLGGAFAGAAVARPGGWLAVLAVALALFAVATLALVALLQEVAARLARSRRFRLYAAAAAVAGWSLLFAAGTGWLRAPATVLAVLGRVQWVAYPPALAAAAARRLYAGDLRGALPFLALLAAAAVVTGALAAKVAVGTALAGGEGAGVPRRAERPGPLSRLDPLLEKELRFLARHPVLRLYAVLLPALTGLLAWRLGGRPGATASELAPVVPLLGVAAYVHLVTQPFWLNAFGWDRGGARLLFLAPLEPAAVLRAKNRAALAGAAALFALCAAAAIAAGRPPPIWAVVGAAALHAGMAPLLHGLGNFVSVLNPRAAAFGAQRAGHLSPLSAFGGMSIVSAVAGAFALPVLVAVRIEQPWAMALGWVALGVVALVAYRASLPRAAALLAARRERLLATVCGDEM